MGFAQIGPRTQRSLDWLRLPGRWLWIGTLIAVLLALPPPTAGAAPATSTDRPEGHPPAAAGWHGRGIQRPHTGAGAVDAAIRPPAGWSAGPVRRGTGFNRPGGSKRVREVQRALRSLGYEAGPVDGLFGPRTKAAVQWFQIKHALAPDGVVDLTTLHRLRERAPATDAAAGGRRAGGPAPATPRPAERPALVLSAPSPRAAEPAPAAGPRAAAVSRERASGGRDGGLGWLPPTLIALAAALLAATLFARRRRGTASREEPRVLGYATGGDSAELRRDAAAIRDACSQNGWALTQVVTENGSHGANGGDRPGLAHALQQVAAGRASRLVVSRVEHLPGSLPDLRALLDSLRSHDAGLVAVDVGIDTTNGGRPAAQSNGGNGRRH